ncbi:hypothetical protein DEU56DRAFT_768980 [Suillus clintonianus]|uniref:uncharacterized protein n=1 Tax=Suillus clintonianus TaxID=1904413 RepID=UPI001B884AFE|nr:uncharacterized protein DEU56DRAFT_768980 [Suillus clintonianus]KAG2155741.1 hypothetical protein DEU56DRAFT_768980 [Suillus clintonianus]
MSNNITAGTGTNGSSNNRLDSSLEADIAHLNTLLLNGSLDGSNETDDLMEILARLDSADGVAKGIEGRLDGILGTLDDLLTSLETHDEASIPEKTTSVEAERVIVSSTESKTSDEPVLSR